MTSQEMKDHGEFIPGREIQVRRDPLKEQMIIYCKVGTFADGCRMYATQTQNDPPFFMIIAPQEEPPLYLRIGDQEADAIADAIRPRPQVNERHLDDTIGVRDRLLTMLEAQMVMGINPDDRGGVHIADEAEIRRGRRSR
jgi:hypothetical protein